MKHAQLSMFNLQRYHNTTGERDERRLSVAEATNKFQDDLVLELMRTRPKNNEGLSGWTSFEIWEDFNKRGRQILETSVRRALTNISKDQFNADGTVYATRERRKGGHGNATCMVWQYMKFKVTN